MGALAMRTQAATIVRRFGFRQVLCIDAVASAALLCSMALSGPQTPRVLLFALFFAVGVTRSILFTSVNTMGYADVSERDMSGATSLAATVQQVATMLGIALASVVLQMLVVARGLQTPGVGEFRAAWVLVGLLSLASLYWFRQLPADAGSSVSGHRGHPAG
jgi:MFS family permease